MERDFEGDYKTSEGTIALDYGLTEALAIGLEVTAIEASFHKSDEDTSSLATTLHESGLGNIQAYAAWRFRMESERQPELFVFTRVLLPHDDQKHLIGTSGVRLLPGIGVVRGFRWRTLAARAGLEYDFASESPFDWGQWSKVAKITSMVLYAVTFREGSFQETVLSEFFTHRFTLQVFMPVLRKLLCFVVLFVSGNGVLHAAKLQYAAEPEWEFVHETQGIRISRRDLPNTGIDEFQGEAVINARIDVIGMALRDVPAYPTWMPDCKRIRFVEKFDEENFIIYQVQNAPWPVLDRDAVVKVSTVIDWEAGRFTVILSDIDDPRIPPTPNLIRIARLNGEWIVEYLDDDHSRVSYRFTVDPSGSLPIAMVNANLQKAPYTTLRGLQRIVREPAYHDVVDQSLNTQCFPFTKQAYLRERMPSGGSTEIYLDELSKTHHVQRPEWLPSRNILPPMIFHSDSLRLRVTMKSGNWQKP